MTFVFWWPVWYGLVLLGVLVLWVKTDNRNQKTGVRNQKSETRGQKYPVTTLRSAVSVYPRGQKGRPQRHRPFNPPIQKRHRRARLTVCLSLLPSLPFPPSYFSTAYFLRVQRPFPLFPCPPPIPPDFPRAFRAHSLPFPLFSRAFRALSPRFPLFSCAFTHIVPVSPTRSRTVPQPGTIRLFANGNHFKELDGAAGVN